MSETRIGLLLDNLPELQFLIRELQQLTIVQNALTEVLPGPLASSVTVASLKAGELILSADSGPVAAKLRQIAPRILNFLRQRGYEITGIHIQVQVRIRDNPLPPKQISLGPEARMAIDKLSNQLGTSPLKSALRRLRRHGI
jgi:hypothetical protein